MKRLVLGVILLIAGFCLAKNSIVAKGGTLLTIKVTSTAFKDGGVIPLKYTCDGEDGSPPISWDTLPAVTQSIALISDDPDAPMGNWVHWVVYNLPATFKELKEGIPPAEAIAGGGKQGINDFGRFGYGGPCPPGGTHRYFFKLYALDAVMDISGKVTKNKLESAMKGHVLAQGELMGRYSRR